MWCDERKALEKFNVDFWVKMEGDFREQAGSSTWKPVFADDEVGGGGGSIACEGRNGARVGKELVGHLERRGEDFRDNFVRERGHDGGRRQAGIA